MNKKINILTNNKFRIILILVIVFVISGICGAVLIINADNIVKTPKQVFNLYFEGLREQNIHKVAAALYPQDSEAYNTFIAENKNTLFPLQNSVGKVEDFSMYNRVNQQSAFANITCTFKNDEGNDVRLQISVPFIKFEGRWYLEHNIVNSSTLPSPNTPPGSNDGNFPAPNTVPLRLSEAQKTEYSINTGKHKTHTVKSTEHVDYETFLGCTYLNEVILPANSNFDASWFRDCANLIAINFDGESNRYSTIDGIVYNRNQTALLYFPRGKGVVAGSSRNKFDNMPTTVTQIARISFASYHGQIKEIVLPSSVKEIEESAFQRAFNSSDYKVILNEGLEKIGANSFEGTLISNLTLPSTVTHIGNEAFKGMENLYELQIPKNSALKAIGYGAFEGATSLDTIVIPRGVEVIENWTFDGCLNLKDVDLQDNIKSIGMFAFRGCLSLVEMYIPSGINYIGKSAFQAAFNLTLYIDAPAESSGWHSSWDLGLSKTPVWNTKFPNS